MPDPVGGTRPPQTPGPSEAIPVGPLRTMSPEERNRALHAADNMPMQSRESRVPPAMRPSTESPSQFRRGDPSSDLRRSTSGRHQPGLELQGYKIETERGATPLENRRQAQPNIVRTR